ncbi:uncharacterized protein GBIM_11658 [Gryllus bimaculatus]|nr:uncharacterized protein GBIM_11658 [Gryllus bimaculatus]
MEVEDVCKDLPDYASCAYMRFRMPNFRDTIYSLLTDSQKKEYHERAMRYLEQETRRCKACHGRHFILLLGTRYERYIGRRYKRRRRRGARRREGERDHESDSGSFTASFSQRVFSDAFGELYTLCWPIPFSQDSSQQSSRISLSRSGRSDDTVGRSEGSIHSFLQQITYEDMLLSKIRQSWGDPDDVPSTGVILGHCRGAELDEKTMDALLEYAEIKR